MRRTAPDNVALQILMLAAFVTLIGTESVEEKTIVHVYESQGLACTWIDTICRTESGNFGERCRQDTIGIADRLDGEAYTRHPAHRFDDGRNGKRTLPGQGHACALMRHAIAGIERRFLHLRLVLPLRQRA